MTAFARCFLLLFAQLYVGGMLALAVPPFHEIERGFYKSTAGVYLGAGVAAFLGRLTLLLGHPSAAVAGPWELVELILWLISLIAATIYLRSLWGEAFQLRARAFAATWICGGLALIVAAQWYRPAGAFSIETLLYPLNFLVSALLQGAVATGMLLGHWYLIDRDLSIAPFRTMLSFFIALLALQATLAVVSIGSLALLGSDATGEALGLLWREHSALLLFRVVLSPLAAAALAAMIWRTLAIPQTMAATGLFYVAILAVFVGEMMGRFILFRTQLPL